jgi:hypothetical protein
LSKGEDQVSHGKRGRNVRRLIFESGWRLAIKMIMGIQLHRKIVSPISIALEAAMSISISGEGGIASGDSN